MESRITWLDGGMSCRGGMNSVLGTLFGILVDIVSEGTGCGVWRENCLFWRDQRFANI